MRQNSRKIVLLCLGEHRRPVLRWKGIFKIGVWETNRLKEKRSQEIRKSHKKVTWVWVSVTRMCGRKFWRGTFFWRSDKTWLSDFPSTSAFCLTCRGIQFVLLVRERMCCVALLLVYVRVRFILIFDSQHLDVQAWVWMHPIWFGYYRLWLLLPRSGDSRHRMWLQQDIVCHKLCEERRRWKFGDVSTHASTGNFVDNAQAWSNCNIRRWWSRLLLKVETLGTSEVFGYIRDNLVVNAGRSFRIQCSK